MLVKNVSLYITDFLRSWRRWRNSCCVVGGSAGAPPASVGSRSSVSCDAAPSRSDSVAVGWCGPPPPGGGGTTRPSEGVRSLSLRDADSCSFDEGRLRAAGPPSPLDESDGTTPAPTVEGATPPAAGTDCWINTPKPPHAGSTWSPLGTAPPPGPRSNFVSIPSPLLFTFPGRPPRRPPPPPRLLPPPRSVPLRSPAVDIAASSSGMIISSRRRSPPASGVSSPLESVSVDSKRNGT